MNNLGGWLPGLKFSEFLPWPQTSGGQVDFFLYIGLKLQKS
jgi:hypothetical protein